jgi:hypothetical protein
MRLDETTDPILINLVVNGGYLLKLVADHGDQSRVWLVGSQDLTDLSCVFLGFIETREALNLHSLVEESLEVAELAQSGQQLQGLFEYQQTFLRGGKDNSFPKAKVHNQNYLVSQLLRN